MNRIDVGYNIKRWRVFNGKKQSVFAKEIGVSRVMLSRYENGRSTISIQLLQTIALKLKIDVKNLMEVG